MPYHIETSSSGHAFPKGKGIVVDDKGRHYSNMPIAITRAKAQMKALHIHVKEKSKK
jgi:hypothetical protein